MLTSSDWSKFTKIDTLGEGFLLFCLFFFLNDVNRLSLGFLDEVEESINWEGDKEEEDLIDVENWVGDHFLKHSVKGWQVHVT
jgi:hypothetical protein